MIHPHMLLDTFKRAADTGTLARTDRGWCLVTVTGEVIFQARGSQSRRDICRRPLRDEQRALGDQLYSTC